MSGNSFFRAYGETIGRAKIDAATFGANFLFDRDRVGDNGTFDEKADALDLGLLRYPGGAIAEESFSLSSPNRVYDAKHSRQLFPLDEFIEYAAETGRDYSLVLPTKQYMDELAATGTIRSLHADLGKFLSRLKDGDFGDKLPAIFEVGNEFYAFGDRSTTEAAKLYAIVAKHISNTLRREFGEEIEIAIQTGVDEVTNKIIYKEIAGASVDKVIFHTYPWTIDEGWGHQERKLALSELWLERKADGIFVSEFNVSNQHRSEDGRILGSKDLEAGMAKATALVDMALNLLAAGVDNLAVWPLQQRTNGDLGGNEGETGSDRGKLSEDGLTLSGEAFKLVSTSLVGSKFIRSFRFDIDRSNEKARFENEVLVHAFDSADERIIFIQAWALRDEQVGHEVRLALDSIFATAEITRVSAASDDYLNPNARPEITTETITHAKGVNSLDVELRDSYEVIRVVLKKYDNLSIGGVEGDLLNGTAQEDLLKGFDGNDTIHGGEGADSIFGGNGDDVLTGSSGRDTVAGGNGGDQIKGGGGRDFLHGEKGDDWLHGGIGFDVLTGKQGSDTLEGGGGRDKLNGGTGTDFLFGGKGNDTLVSGYGNDFVEGGDGSDTLRSKHGNDTLGGGAGTDEFRVTASEGGRTVYVRDFVVGLDRLIIEGEVESSEIDFIVKQSRTLVIAGKTKIVVEGVGVDDLDIKDVALRRPGSSADNPVGTLSVGVNRDITLGHKYLSLWNDTGTASLAFDGSADDMSLEFRSFDIDVTKEIEILLNGKHLAYLDKVGNNAFGHHELDILADEQLPGVNTLEFIAAHPTAFTWGLDEFVLA